jgi:hypothetical protein
MTEQTTSENHHSPRKKRYFSLVEGADKFLHKQKIVIDEFASQQAESTGEKSTTKPPMWDVYPDWGSTDSIARLQRELSAYELRRTQLAQAYKNQGVHRHSWRRIPVIHSAGCQTVLDSYAKVVWADEEVSEAPSEEQMV